MLAEVACEIIVRSIVVVDLKIELVVDVDIAVVVVDAFPVGVGA